MWKFIKGAIKFTFYVSLTLLLIFFPIFFLFDKYFHISPPVTLNLPANVEVHADKSVGSGVVYLNQDKAFVWTCAHVVANNINTVVCIDFHKNKLTGTQTKKPLNILVKLFNNDFEEYGEVKVWAKIVRYSYNDDIALLELSRNHVFHKGVDFPKCPNYKVYPGTKIFHIGSMSGEIGHKSMVEGIHGMSGLKLEDHKKYDRLGMNIQSGSSGGGVFEVNTGLCIGIVARSQDEVSKNQAYMIGWTRMVEFAKRLDCMWALDHRRSVPEDYLDVFSDDVLELPDTILKHLK